jgi:hypothetical protein
VLRLVALLGLLEGCRYRFDDLSDAVPADGAGGVRVSQTAETSAGSQVTVSPTGADHLVVVGIQIDAAHIVTAVSDNAPGGSSVFTQFPSGRAVLAAADSVSLWYSEASRPGATLITATSPVVPNAMVVWEVEGIRTVNSFDVDAELNDQLATTTPGGPVLNTAVDGELVISVVIGMGDITGIQPGNEFTNDRLANHNGWAHLTSASAGPHQAVWSQATSQGFCSIAGAFLPAP